MANYPKRRTFSYVYRQFYTGTDTSQLVTSPTISWTDTRNGVQQPRWRDIVKQHGNATTAFTASRYRIQGHTSGIVEEKHFDAAVNSVVTNRIAGDLIDGNDIGILSAYVNPSMATLCANEALSRFYQNCWSAFRSLQGGVFIGELKEALGLIRSPAKSLRRAVDAYYMDAKRRTRKYYRSGQRIDPVKIKDLHKVLADTWLENSFGWQPLMADIKSGAEALAKLSTHAYDYKRVSGYSERSTQGVPFPGGVYTKTFVTFYIRYRLQSNQVGWNRCRYLGEVKIAVDKPITMAKELFGFHPNDFVPTVWELIPYSFLVDYFTNIGDVISAWSFPVNKITWWCRTTHAANEKFVSASALNASNPNPAMVKLMSLDGPSLKVYIDNTQITRGSDTFLGLPSVTFEIPGSSRKWMNIAALASMRRL